MSPESTGQNEHYLHVARRRFRAWRGDRPFWAGLFTILGGAPIAYFPYADLHLGNMTLTMSTTAGAGSLIIGVLLITLGLTMWFHHIVRVFAGVAAILLALISIPVANIGGFVIGFVFALIGGALSVSWAPGEPRSDEDPLDEQDPRRTSLEKDLPYEDALHAAAVPQQQAAGADPAADADAGRHRAG
ncbi:DUF6114 domain-containing protein [Streptomyces sp. TRM75563]|uniref:DUF6114 domain-containing protein n=1 Tax=Streptomyces sp. TRM75563 TaxID=2817418 RepID=UPI001F61632E|nr:DUF6114 domain-containing protein [Streptomyces sp. TRM75563]MCI4043880.1 DUF6114 domain-containing protein [Streptomyces sp. TRM75563]